MGQKLCIEVEDKEAKNDFGTLQSRICPLRAQIFFSAHICGYQPE